MPIREKLVEFLGRDAFALCAVGRGQRQLVRELTVRYQAVDERRLERVWRTFHVMRVACLTRCLQEGRELDIGIGDRQLSSG